ncbi:hypothetical protein DMY01_03470 [Cutibacterium avidum]|nr:hypothetical protein A9G02_01275 [Cutibacterium avidum]TMT53604.1 hypothetical protein DMY01_03470 [Cutibacterium avidum]
MRLRAACWADQHCGQHHEKRVRKRESFRDAPNAGCHRARSLQMDTVGRYRGEVHLMVHDDRLDGDFVRVGEIAGPYTDLVPQLAGGMQVDFVVRRPT